ncbi:MAG: mechanosensitive ion channel family protein [Rhodospirillaceae bacterium]|nr:mechanosensitive ion channel family protein [Rhodospirillales bacterium]
MGAAILLKLVRVAVLLAGPSGLLLITVLLRLEVPTLASAWLTDADTRKSVELAAIVAEWIASGWLLNRSILIFLWEGLIRQRMKASPPKVLVDLSAVLIWTGLGSLMLAVVFRQSLTGLLATSTVTLGVAGFAVRELISDFFAGIALSIERPLMIGDWISVDGHTGKVTEMTWRAVRLVNTEGITIVVPNGNIAGDTFRNFSTPDSWFRDEVRLLLPYSVAIPQVRRILLSAVSQVPELAAYHKAPQVAIVEYTDRAMLWRVMYWVPDYSRMSTLRFVVHQNIQRNLHASGIYLPVPTEEVHVLRHASVTDAEPSSRHRMLRNTPLFRELEDDDLEQLAQAAQQRDFAVGEHVIHQGDEGASLFLLNEGLLAVTVHTPDGGNTEVGQIIAGNAFGEMSLLTGAPRGATVTAVVESLVTEIHKDAMAQLLTTRPHIAKVLSRTLAERQMHTDKRMAASGQPTHSDETSIAGQFLTRILTFFNLPATLQS